MVIQDLLSVVNEDYIKQFSEDTEWSGVAYELADLFDFNGYIEFTEEGVKAINYTIIKVPLLEWICTDTHVGINAFYRRKRSWLTWELVGVTTQPYRKSDAKFYWATDDMYEDIRKYILKYVQRETPMFETLESTMNIDSFHKIFWESSRVTHNILSKA